jgi:hypothetical protein
MQRSHLFEGLGQNVLAGMLLGVVDPPTVVDRPNDFRANVWQVSLDDVVNGLDDIDHVDDGRRAERSDVVRLAARRWVECRSIENQNVVAARPINSHHSGRELP